MANIYNNINCICVFVGRIDQVNASIFESAESTVNLMLTFLVRYVCGMELWK